MADGESGMSMERGEVVALVETLETEVNNGGFDQFFYNAAGDRTAETIAALQEIGAPKMAAIVRRAAGLFPGGMAPADQVKRRTFLEGVSRSPIEFHELDNQFYQYPDNLMELVEKYAASAS